MSDPASDLEKLMKDMYFGEGKDNPPMTTRMRALEDAIGRFNTIGMAVLLMVVSLFGKAVWDVITAHAH